MTSLAPPLLRITLVAGRRRLDLVVPAGLPVAELLPELAHGAGLGAAPTGAWHLAPLGRPPLDPEQSLAAQGVGDGGVLMAVPAALHRAPPPRHDDPVEAWAEAWAAMCVEDAEASMEPSPAPSGARHLALPAMAVGGVLLAAGPVGAALPSGVEVAVAPLAVALLAALTCVLPRAALVVVSSPAGEEPVDRRRAAHDLRSVADLVAASTVTVAALLLLALPTLLSRGAAGGALAAVAAGALALHERPAVRSGPELSGVLGCGLFAALGAQVLHAHPEWWVMAGVLLVGGGAVFGLVGLLLRPARLLDRCAHRLRQLCLVPLAPLAVVAAGLPELLR